MPQNFMPLRTAADWARLTTEGLAALIVGPDRLQWILDRYPPTDMGRPGIIHHTPRGERHVREMDAGAVAPDEPESWRMTFEFAGKDALELAESAAD